MTPPSSCAGCAMSARPANGSSRSTGPATTTTTNRSSSPACPSAAAKTPSTPPAASTSTTPPPGPDPRRTYGRDHLAGRTLAEPEAPVQHLLGILRAGRRAGGGAAQDDPDQRPAVPDRLEQQAVPGRVGVAGLDPGGALVGADQRVGIVPPVLVVPGPLRQVVEPQVHDRPEDRVLHRREAEREQV